MSTFIPKYIVLLIALFLLNGCEAEAKNTEQNKVEQELSALKQEVSELKKQLATIGSQVKDIHNIALASQQPKHKTLTTQENFDNNDALAKLGEASAGLAIVEFSDYQCPYCKRYVDTTFTKLRANFIDKGKLKYIARDFPLGFHKQAKGAAIAANCSLQQGAYWPMREQLFNNMRQLGDELYQSSAEQLDLDMDQFTKCLEDEAVLAKVEQDMNYGSSLGIRGTPSFLVGKVEDGHLINPTLLVGAQSYETFAAVLNELAAAPAQEAGE
ncbi:thioredoxin domain-containing protein [Pseudoalteromonas sp. BDTF-M6]|uniref:thioredoxin domain-containing protein n=1 Tax=Pseudoalteromonas sp. BDTF-M6 TaxID=2796132 RepID=UPI001BAEA550|nr:thioredoxin domain-containing protein [Pseudoalteromonas sp. BDTF-M6]MBS3797697.1 thioredoxin domain-containing protein [Pseudoalteromonas sp. BDTF-M6]